MMEAIKKGDRVSWSTGRGRSRGPVERVITARAKVGGRSVVGSRADPRYLVRDERTGATAVRKGDALRRLGAARTKAGKAPARRTKAGKAPARRAKVAAPKAPVQRTGKPRRALAKAAATIKPGLRGRRPDWRVVVGVAVGVLVTAIVAGYFTQLPNRFADDYRDDAAPAFERVDEAMYEAFESFRVDYFQGLAIEELTKKRLDEDLGQLRRLYRRQYSSDRKAIAKARTAVDAAEEAIADEAANLTEVESWPLMGGLDRIEESEESAEAAQRYLDEAGEFAPLFRELLDYSQKTLKLEEEITNILLDDSPGAGASLGTYRSWVGGVVGDLKKAKRRFKALKESPATARAFEFATDRGLELALGFYSQIQTAFQNLDPGLFDRAGAQLDRKVRKFGLDLLVNFQKLQSDSPVSTAIESLESAEEELAEMLDADAGEESVAPPLFPLDDRGDKRRA